MNTDRHGFKHGDITQKIIGVFYEVYNELGHGFLESVYEEALCVELTLRNIRFCSPSADRREIQGRKTWAKRGSIFWRMSTS